MVFCELLVVGRAVLEDSGELPVVKQAVLDGSLLEEQIDIAVGEAVSKCC